MARSRMLTILLFGLFLFFLHLFLLDLLQFLFPTVLFAETFHIGATVVTMVITSIVTINFLILFIHCFPFFHFYL